MRWSARSSIAGLSLTLAALAPAGAQRVSGFVRDSGAVAPLSGAVVIALDARNQTVSRAISDAAGRYSVEAPASAASLRVVRIGFQPRVIPLPSARAASIVVDAWMVKVASLLTARAVTNDRLCSTKSAPASRSICAMSVKYWTTDRSSSGGIGRGACDQSRSPTLTSTSISLRGRSSRLTSGWMCSCKAWASTLSSSAGVRSS